MDIYALNLRMSATGDIGALGGSANAIDTEVVNLAAATTTAGGINILENTNLTIGSIAGSTIACVAVDAVASTYPDPVETVLNGIVTAGNGTIVVRTADGDLKVDAAINANGSGNILVQAQGENQDVDLNADVQSGTGNISVLGAGSVLQDGNIFTGGTGTIDVGATTGAITMGAVNKALTDGTDIRYAAAGNVTVGMLDARTAADRTAGVLDNQGTWGAVSIVSGAAILDTAEATVDVYANEVRLNATTAIGAGTNHLEIEAAKASAVAVGGGLFVTESTDITIGQTAIVTVNRVKADGTVILSTVSDAAQSNLISGGALVLQTVDGSIETLATQGPDNGFGQCSDPVSGK